MIRYTSWTIPDGNVVKVTDESGAVIWQLVTATDEPPAIFEVAKQTATTYAGATKYTDEQFVLFDIFPKKGGTVKITYGGLTKTVKDTSLAEAPNAIQVFFGTFNGVSDSVATPASGRLTIEGAYRGYGIGAYSQYANKVATAYAPCITSVIDFGNPVYIGQKTFNNCANFTPTSLPIGITSIGTDTFRNCANLTLTSLPSGVTSIGNYAFYGCTNVGLTSLPSGVTSLGQYALYGCENTKSITIPASVASLGLRSLECYHTTGSIGDKRCDTSVKMLGTTPPTMEEEAGMFNDSGAFGRNSFYTGTITVPKGCGNVYKATDVWNHYESKIVEAS
jgi:hypothetical protein